MSGVAAEACLDDAAQFRGKFTALRRQMPRGRVRENRAESEHVPRGTRTAPGELFRREALVDQTCEPRPVVPVMTSHAYSAEPCESNATSGDQHTLG